MKSNIDEQFLQDKRLDIGETLRYYRRMKGVSQQKMADDLGITQTTIAKIEKGKWNFGIDTLHTFCEYLKLDITIE